LSLVLRELAASGDVEGPRGVVAGFDRDAACPSGGMARRVRCHLARATVEVTSRCEASGWLFTVYLPELSDHVHSVRVWRDASGELGVDMSSEN
jgi:transcription elongation factor Elf1